MPCRSPLRQYPARGGGTTFNVNQALMAESYWELPCGSCIDCRVRNARDWTIRATHEAGMHQASVCLTLTYRENPYSLSRKDIALFLKNMRYRFGKLSYFGCGEYGEKLSRPHYHIIFYGIHLDDLYPWRKQKKVIYYRSPTIEKIWEHGHVEISEFSPGAASYVAGYVTKKITGDQAEIHYKTITIDGEIKEVSPELLFCGKRPALGISWLQKHWRDVYPADQVIFKGKEYLPPRTYDRWLDKNHPHVWELVKANRLDYAANEPRESEETRALKAKARDYKNAHLTREFKK